MLLPRSWLAAALTIVAACTQVTASAAAQDAGCRAPRHYKFTSSAPVKLSCNGNGVAVFDIAVPDQGRAVARASLSFGNTNTSAIYYHSTRIEVGVPEIAFNSGADVCPRTRTWRRVQILGSGKLVTNATRVRVMAHQGSAPCTDGQIVTLSGAELDVWVEDAAPHCAGKYVNLISYQGDVIRKTGKNEKLFHWDGDGNVMHQTRQERAPGATRVRLLSSVEGTSKRNPNSQCGQERGRIAIEHQLNGQMQKRQSLAIPASAGMGHAMLGLDTDAALSKDKFTARLVVRKDIYSTDVTTGGCCGDGMFATIQY